MKDEIEKIFNLSLDMIGSGTLDGYFVEINNSFEHILGYSKAEFLKHPFTYFVHKNDLKKTKTALEDAARGKKTIHIQNRYRCRDGSYKLIEWNVSSIIKDNKFVAVGREISEQKFFDDSLTVFIKAVEASSDAVGMSTAEGLHYYQNRAFDEMFGDIGSDPPDTLYVDEKIGREVFATITGGEPWDGDVKMYGKNGDVLDILLRAYPIKNEKGIVKRLVGVHTNITNRLKLEKNLRRERDRAQKYLDIAGVMIVVLNPDQTVSLVNKKGCEILGYNENEILGKNWFDHFIKSDHAEEIKNVFNQIMSGNIEQVEYFENSIITKNGEEKIIAWHNSILKNDSGTITASISSGDDITEQKKIEDRLRRSQAILSATQKLTKVGGWEWDIKKETMLWTDEVYRIHDMEPGEFTPGSIEHIEKGIECYDLIDRPVIMNAFQQCIEKGKPYDLEFPFTTVTGRRIWVRTSAEPMIKNGRIVRVLGNIMDITQRKTAEKSLQKAHDELELKVQKRTRELSRANEDLQIEVNVRLRVEKELIKSHGQLRDLSQHIQGLREQERKRIAREVHDDLGQSLTAIKFDVAWLRDKIDQNQKELIKKTDRTIDLIDGAIKTVKRISTELRPGLLDDLGLVAAIEWYAQDFYKRTRIKVDTVIDPLDIEFDDDLSTTIFRIFQESLTNVARHSEATRVKANLSLKNNLIEFIITDNGIGISTKDFVNHDSYGLLGIKERVHMFGGEVHVSSMPDKGTKLQVSIPHK